LIKYSRRFGWKAYTMDEETFHFNGINGLPFIKYITRTHALPATDLPDIYSSSKLKSKIDHYSEGLKQPLEEAIKFELYGVE